MLNSAAVSVCASWLVVVLSGLLSPRVEDDLVTDVVVEDPADEDLGDEEDVAVGNVRVKLF